MKLSHVALAALALSMTAQTSAAGPDAGAAKVVIPPLVIEQQLARFDAEPFPADKSKAPKLDEWKGAAQVRLTRVSPAIKGCDAYRVREWIKIHCNRKTAGMRLLAGSTEGVELWVPEPLSNKDDGDALATLGRFGEIVFPARRGDARVFETIDLNFGDWEGWGTSSAVLVEERWPEGAKGPDISLLSP